MIRKLSQRPAGKLWSGMLGMLASLVLVPAALAGTPVELNANLVDATGQVTLGELFTDAGPARNVVVAQRTGPTVVLDAAAVQAFARRYGLDWDNPRGLARLIVRSQGPLAGPGRNQEILTWTRNLATGEIVQPSDIVWARAAAVPYDAPGKVELVIGEAARHPLREGDAVLVHDVAPPLVVKAGDTVLVTYADDGVTLTLEAKALASAAAGDAFNVQNPASKKVIEVVATGVDQAAVGPAALQMRAQSAQQIALR
jgi:flagella basal body P-ring formation protein FlgA